MSTKPSNLITVRVYYEDTDFSQRVYHASYLRFLERGRTELLRRAGFSSREIAATQRIVFAVRSLQIEYFAPANMDDFLRIETRVDSIGGAVVEFGQRIFRDEKELVAAKVRVAVIRNDRPVRIPAGMRKALGCSENA